MADQKLSANNPTSYPTLFSAHSNLTTPEAMNIGDDASSILGDMVIGTFTIPTENGMETDQGENHLIFGF